MTASQHELHRVYCLLRLDLPVLHRASASAILTCLQVMIHVGRVGRVCRHLGDPTAVLEATSRNRNAQLNTG